jgi:hypothetical protein
MATTFPGLPHFLSLTPPVAVGQLSQLSLPAPAAPRVQYYANLAAIRH